MLKAIQIIAITLAGTVLVGTFALIFAESRWVDPNPSSPRDYFLHGSTGTELMPLAVFQVLPTLFPEQFQPAGTPPETGSTNSGSFAARQTQSMDCPTASMSAAIAPSPARHRPFHSSASIAPYVIAPNLNV